MGAGCSSRAVTTVSNGDGAPQPQPLSKACSMARKADGTITGGPAKGTSNTPPPARIPKRKLTILHFNDVYNIEEQARDPKGGASRLCAKVREFRERGVNPLVLFSGDAYNPSSMSIITLGKQMVDVLNEIGVNVACIGNHDFDYGLENLMKLNSQCKFPWLMANVLERGKDTPYGGAGSTWLQDWNGVKVGVVGLVEEEWMETLGAVNVEDMEYRDFIQAGRQAARELQDAGAELLIAVTHMREPNDRKLAAEVPEFHLVLGGHDHHYVSEFIQPTNNLLVKSGTDFRDLSVVEVGFYTGDTTPGLTVQRIPIDSSVPEDPAMKAIVDEYVKLMGEKMDEEVGETLEPLDGRFQTVRNRESNLGNLVADVWRKAAKADIALLHGGSLRSDTLHPAGALRARDWVAILPYVSETMVLECTGAQIVEALENGVSQWPNLEGRFPQVSGLKFKFDPSKPPGQRVVSGSVVITEMEGGPVPIDPGRGYKVAVAEYVARGRDGYSVFADCRTLVDGESGVVVPTAIRNHFLQMQVLNRWDTSKATLAPAASKWLKKAATSRLESESGAASGAEGEGDGDAADKDGAKSGEEEGEKSRSKFGMKAVAEAQKRTHGLSVHHPEKGYLVIGPIVEGRIINVLEEPEEAQEGQGEGQREQVEQGEQWEPEVTDLTEEAC